MRVSGMLLGFLDELEKVSAFNTMGLSPETVLEKSQPPPPMESVGFEKARNILDRAAQMKTAAVDVKFRQGGALTKPKDDSGAESAKSVGGYALAGGGAGKMLADFSHGPAVHNVEKFRKVVHKGTGIGLAAGAAYGVHRAIQRKKAKQATIVKTAKKDVPYSTGERAALLAGAIGTGATSLNEARHLVKGTNSNHGYLGYLSVPLAVGAVALKRHMQGKTVQPGMSKKATISTPALALKASKQVGKIKTAPSVAGPSINTQIRGQLIGKKGTP